MTFRYTQQSVHLRYTLVDGGGFMRPPAETVWYFDLPEHRNRPDLWTELLHRIFYDSNVRLRRQEPRDEAWLALRDFTAAPIDVPHMLGWNGDTSVEATAQYHPWIIASMNVTWEPAACYVVGETGAYDTRHGADFAELLLWRGLESGVGAEPAARAFMRLLYPGAGDTYFADRQQRFHNLLQVRPTTAFRKPPGIPPVCSGPVEPVHLSVRHG